MAAKNNPAKRRNRTRRTTRNNGGEDQSSTVSGSRAAAQPSDSKRRRPSLSTTKLSTAYLEGQGYTVAKTEQRIPYTVITRDLWGADLIAIKAGEPPMLVQTTTKHNLAARVNKVLGIPAARLWKDIGCAFEFHGWWKEGAKWNVEIRQL